MYNIHTNGHYSTGVPTPVRYRCRCHLGRRKRIIPFIANLYSAYDQEVNIPLEKIHLEVSIRDGMSFTNFIQVYKNTTKNPIECVYKFPRDEEYLVSGFTIKSGDKVIRTDIMKKKQADEKYDDAVASGNTSVKANLQDENLDLVDINVGYIPPQQEIEVVVHIVHKLESLQNGFYAYIFPYELIPGARKYARMTKSDAKVCAKFNWEITMNFMIQSLHEISSVIASHQMKTELSEDKKVAKAMLSSKTSELDSNIMISYSTDGIRLPTISLFSDQKIKNEVAAHITFIPRLSEELKETADPAEESKEESKESSACEEQDETNEIAKGEYIFLLDRSASMGGPRLQAAKRSLELFIRSIPLGSKFNVVSFGGTGYHYKFFEESADFEEANVKTLLDSMDEFKANMGGTNIYDPLKAIFDEKRDSKNEYTRHLFLLTDGGVENTDDVIELIRSNNLNTRVHTFGIGYSASPRLIFEGAAAGLGCSEHSSEFDQKLNSKVIKTLRKAAKPAYTQMKIDWGKNNSAVKYFLSDTVTQNYYEEEPLHLNVIFDQKKLVEADIKLTFYNTLTSKEDTFIIPIDPKSVEEDSKIGRSTFQSAAKEYIDLLTLQNTQNKSKKSQELINSETTKLALKYSLLTKTTAFFGKIKTKSKSGEEMKSVVIPAPFSQTDLHKAGTKSQKLRLINKYYPPDFSKSLIDKNAVNMRKPRGTKSRTRAKVRTASKSKMKCCKKMSTLEASLGEMKNQKRKREETITKSLAESDKFDYTQLVEHQNIFGVFTDLPDQFKPLLSSKTLKNIPNSSPEVLATLIALAILKSQCSKTKFEWQMLAHKAMNFLKQQGVSEPSKIITQLISEI
ncbi:unnamed protein product [Moneuplotes crassus]|uniref:Uncharacterized protein n=1 Tax=Euplotes crassus TaxID=5936 RepID=A0AAD2D7E9_EUPCR|nr:unnamed protein product [Moneuplotes crassus]